ncbi:MAG: hypothetical protein KAX49_05575 [Halanaerobiales bacterium]|nr:hypothetical protein [Halanaerobiales bacterium]
MANWLPIENLFLNGGYVYFNNQKYDSYTKRYNWNANYALESKNFNFNGLKTKIKSVTAETDRLELTCTTSIDIFKNLNVNYKIDYENFQEFNKVYGTMNQKSEEHSQNFGLSYFIKDDFCMKTEFGYSTNSFGIGEVLLTDKGYTLDLGFEYKKDLEHLIVLSTGLESKEDNFLNITGIELNF